MSRIGEYRIRWGIVSYGNGYRISRERMCIAERRYWLGWWPVAESDWHFDEAKALRDIERDKAIRAPLPATKQVA
jgi:hypothetical protein